MTSPKLVGATLEFPYTARREMLSAFLSLPGDLRPTQHREAEDEPRIPVNSSRAFLKLKTEDKGGFLLYADRASYSVDSVGKHNIICYGYDIEVMLTEKFLTHMAKAGALFGFACTSEEKDHRNRLIAKLDDNHTVESWVGRNIQKSIPGLYWLTLLSESLAEKHGVPLAALGKIALDHVRLGGGLHLFRFYERPEDWKLNSTVESLCSSLSGIFDIKKVKSKIDFSIKNPLKFLDQLDEWH